jgi:hypothetical protein
LGRVVDILMELPEDHQRATQKKVCIHVVPPEEKARGIAVVAGLVGGALHGTVVTAAMAAVTTSAPTMPIIQSTRIM